MLQQKEINFSDIEVTAKSLGYLGLISGTIKDIGLIEKIDALLPMHKEKGVKVSHGERTSAMLLNGLGFMNDRLYMVEEFFHAKPMEKLFGRDIKEEYINDDALGRSLDAIHKYGVTKLFANLAFSIGAEQKLIGVALRHDSTSISVSGEFKDLLSKKNDDYDNDFSFEYGYSKDHRSDLKQMILGLSTTGLSNFPIWFEVMSGNTSDKTSFHETKEKIEKFQKEIDYPENFIFVLDSAFYNKDKLLSYVNSQWVTRVPETVKEARRLLEKQEDVSKWKKLDENYQYRIESQSYGGITHKWKLVFSKDAHKKEIISFEKRLEKNMSESQKKVKQLMKEEFQCSKDAHKAAKKLDKKLKYFNLQYTDQAVLLRKKLEGSKYEEVEVHKLDITIKNNKEEQDKARNKLGKFIIATNIMDNKELDENKILKTYKSLSGTEKGFRFLKDNAFHASSVFLKTPERVQALMMIMALCLMIYNISEHRLRQSMKDKDATLPNQVGKQIKNPTFKWIAQMMRGIMVTYCFLEGKQVKSNVSNLNDVHKKIITLYGGAAVRIYELG